MPKKKENRTTTAKCNPFCLNLSHGLYENVATFLLQKQKVKWYPLDLIKIPSIVISIFNVHLCEKWISYLLPFCTFVWLSDYWQRICFHAPSAKWIFSLETSDFAISPVHLFRHQWMYKQPLQEQRFLHRLACWLPMHLQWWLEREVVPVQWVSDMSVNEK